MSAIDPTVPVDTEQRSQGASRIREHRQWLYAFATAFLACHGGSGYDPSTYSGVFKVPQAVSGTPLVGEMYFTSGGQLHVHQAGGADKLAGDLAATTKCLFRQASAPTGWTRNTGLTNGSGLQYRSAATPTAGGAQDIGTALTHSTSTQSPVTSGISGSTSRTFMLSMPDHAALKYLDVMIAARD